MSNWISAETKPSKEGMYLVVSKVLDEKPRILVRDFKNGKWNSLFRGTVLFWMELPNLPDFDFEEWDRKMAYTKSKIKGL